MTSYAVAHLKVRRTIKETLGHVPSTQLSSNIYLTNTLAPPNSSFERAEQMSLFDFSTAITDEAYKADTWKARRPITVIIGNPPYLAASTNPFDISAYKTETDGVTKLDEKNPKWLGDDYVKFFRFAQEIIERDGEGVLAYVSPHGFLDNPTFRGMRASLLRTFDKIFIINLHGNSNKGEVSPDGKVDENIFDIKQGISLFIGSKTTAKPEWASVKYADLWGTRKNKFDMLSSNAPSFTTLTPDRKMAYMVPLGDSEYEQYMNGIGVNELFSDNVVGVVTARDALCIQNTHDGVESVLREFQTKDIEQLRSQYKLGADARDWSVEGAKKDVETLDGKIVQIAYRPFDNRYTYYTGRSKGFHCMPRGGVMKHILISPTSPIGKNVGLVFTKGDSTPNEFSMIFISDTLIDNRLTAAQTAGIASIAPLYIYRKLDSAWIPNFASDVLARLTAHMTFQPSPIEVFDYIYGVLHDPLYRKKYNEFLKRGYPRVPIINAPEYSTDDFIVTEDMFRAYVAAGERLRKLHLMQTKIPAALEIEPSTAGNLEIGAVKYKGGILHLNPNKRILGIPEDVWNYYIGGYQVLDKWFKSHKGETMSIGDFDHIANVVGLLAETIKIQGNLRSLHMPRG